MKVRLKITLVMLSLLALLFGAGGSALIGISFATAYEQEKEAALNSYRLTLNTLSLVSQIEKWADSSNVSEALEQLQTQNALSLWAFRLSKGATTLYESSSTAQTLKSTEVALEPGNCLFLSFAHEGAHYLQIHSTFFAGDESLSFDAAYDISSLYAAREQQQNAFFGVFAIMLIVCALLAYFSTWLLTRPLVRLSNASRELARGNLSYRAEVMSNDEIGMLASDFNVMAAQLEQGFSSLKSTMAMQERFMASFAHELKTPMTSIMGFAELLRSQTLTTEEQMDAAHYIFSEGRRLESLSFKLLDILGGGQESLEMVRMAPSALISKLIENLKPVYEKEGISLSYRASGGACRMEPDLITSLLLNLLDNARKALSGEDGGAIHLESKVSRNKCWIRVADNGKGIPAEALAHLTEAFYRADKSRAREQGGAGLGLTLCAKIAQVHGGSLEFESREGVGTTVHVVLRGGQR